MIEEIEKILKKYIDYKKTDDGLTYVWEGKLNEHIVMVRYSEMLNKLFCGIENGSTYLTGDAKKKGKGILKRFEKQLQVLYIRELD